MKTRLIPLVILLLCISMASFSQTNYYVTPSGLPANNGSSFSSAMDLKTALNAAKAGDSVILQGGTYTIPYSAGNKNSLVFSKSGALGNPITVSSYNNSIATLDFSFPELEWVQASYGLSVTGSYWHFKGLKITRAGYQGAYVTGGYNTFENCIFYDNRNTGLEINKGGHHTTVINCDAYYNYDPKKGGSMADGFGPKESQGAGNKFIGCRAWENSDDGYDCYDSPEIVIFENCWAFNNGVDVWHYPSPALAFAGNGNGFKVGGNSKLANHKLTKCISFGQPGKGFDQNNNTGGLTLYNCTAYKNGSNFGLGNTLASGEKHVLKNNISLSGTVSLTSATEANNTWNSGFSVSTSDFESLNLSLATSARNNDGSLPETTLFKLKSGSMLIDAGVNVGLAYSGSAPDLGAIEYNKTINYTLTANVSGSGSVSGGGTYPEGTSVSITASPASGWKFDNWSNGSTSNTTTIVLDANKNITAYFSQIQSGLTATIQENTTGFCGVDGTIDNNNSGFTGDGFANTTNTNGTGIDYKINSTGGSATLLIQYASSSARPANIIVNNSVTISDLSMPSTGSWTKWNSISTNITLISGVNDLRIEATSSAGLANIDYISISGSGVSAADCNGTTTPVTYTLATSTSGSGSLSGAGTYKEGTEVTLTASPSSGFELSNWNGIDASSGNTATVTMNSNRSVSVAFTQIPISTTYALTTTINGQGSVNPSSGTFEEGTSVSMTATPASGWKFDSWSSGSASNPVTIVMNSDKSITANFSEILSGSIALTSASGDSQVDLIWNSSNITAGFEVYRDLDSDPSGRIRIATTASTNYTDGDVSNGTTYYYWIKATDVNGTSINSNVAMATPQGLLDTELTIQENQTGFCSLDGTIDNNNSGFTGDGFSNTTNASGTGINWRVNFASTANYTFILRYASSSDRPANLIINGSTVVSNISFPSTGSWTTWSTVSFTATVSAGTKIVRLEATGSAGLGNIDYISISGNNPQAGDCAAQLKDAEESLSMSETEKLNMIEVYPNPFSTSATIRFTLNSPQQISFKIYDLTGRIVDEIAENNFDSGENSILYDNPGLIPGIYMLNIQNGAIIKNKRLVVE